MADLHKRKHQRIQKQDALKKRRLPVAPEQFDDDDESGGGAGKRMQRSYGLEKLLGVIADGKIKAKSVWRFLSKEGLDSGETQKTKLQHQKEEKQVVTEKQEKADEFKETQERAKELQEDKKSPLSDEQEQQFIGEEEKEAAREKASKEEPAWKKADASDANARQRFGFDSAPDATGTKSNAEAVRRAIMGERIAGSVISGTTNPLGFTKQVDATGETGIAQSQASEQGRLDIQGGRAQGAIHSKHYDHHGSLQYNHWGRSGDHFAYSKGDGAQNQSAASATESTQARKTGMKAGRS